jgi:hypothetical protein
VPAVLDQGATAREFERGVQALPLHPESGGARQRQRPDVNEHATPPCHYGRPRRQRHLRWRGVPANCSRPPGWLRHLFAEADGQLGLFWQLSPAARTNNDGFAVYSRRDSATV